MKKGKRYSQAFEKIDREKKYLISEAIQMLSEFPHPKFDQTVELHIRLGVDPKKADQMVRGAIMLPHGIGKEMTVLVFAEGDKAEEAKKAGADFVGMDDLAEKIQNGWTEFDVAISTPNLMGKVGKLGKILGPRKLMPNPKSGTVTMDIEDSVKESKAGKIEYRIDKYAIIHTNVGKVSFKKNQLTENIKSLVKEIVQNKPASAKGKYIKNITICSTMSPGIKIDAVALVKEL
ncbi:MAG: 50S ribosomal protein L1 [Candidatus Cloacimonetes bacterium]|nr:50S ribosomal protein L1 [Candidatus Cloacimonadota bacterium]